MKQLLHNKVATLLLFVMCFFVTDSWSQITISSSTTLTQNFDGIGSTASASIPSNWKMTAAGASSPTWSAGTNVTVTTQQASSGSPATGGRYNWGNGTTTTDRAVGFMTSGGYASPNSLMVHFQNTSGVQMNDVTFAFDYERYRVNSAACSVTFFTSTDGSTWTARTDGDSGAFATGSNAYNFSAGTVVNKSFTLTGINIPNNGNLYLRWNFNTTGSNSQGVGLDNFSLTPTLAPLGPIVTTSAPTNITTSSVDLNGSINANGSSVDGSFDFGTSTSPYSNSYSSTPSVITGTSATAVSASVSSLNANSLYNYRAVGDVSSSLTTGSNVAFYTLANTPLQPQEATVVTSTGFDFNFIAEGNPFTTEYAIQIGTQYLQANGTLGASPIWRSELAWQIEPVPGLINVIGLTPNTTYLYAVKARNGDGVETPFGPSQTVTTLPNTEPSLTADPLTGFGSVCVNETVGPNSFGLLGEFLTGDVTVGPLDGFSFSTTEANPTYSSSLTLSPDGNNELLEIIYVKFTPTMAQPYDGNILISGGGASDINISVTGLGINTQVTAVTVSSSSVTATSATITGTITPGCSTVTSSGLEYSTSNDMSGSIQVSNPANLTGLEPNTQYFYRAYAADGIGAVTGAILTFTTSQLSAPVGLPASDITATSFVANWQTVAGADGYRLDVSVSPSFGVTTPTSNLFISEYGEGTPGNRKYIEIYNGTGSDVDLSNYQIFGINNGGSWPESTLSLSGTLVNNGKYVIANNAADTPGANLYTTAAPINFNGDDAIGLAYNGGSGTIFTLIDAIGTDGPDVGNGWAVAGINNATVDKILIRKPTVLGPNTDWTTSAGTNEDDSEWIVSTNPYNASFPPTDLGLHTIDNSSPSFVFGYEDLNVGSSLSYEVTGLNAETTYYYRVRATSANSTSASSTPAISVVTTAAPPTFGSVSQSVNIACDDSDATFFINGLVPNSVSNITYNINNGDDVVITNVAANPSGSATVLIRLFLENDGQVLTITQIERTDAVSDILFLTENNTVSLVVSSNSNFYQDFDGDGYGNPLVVVTTCEAPPGFVTNNTDCDDAAFGVNPGVSEVAYDGIDNDCNGVLDNGFAPFTANMVNCGTTLANIASLISCVSTPNAVGYQFEIRKVVNGVPLTDEQELPQTIVRSAQFFSLTSLANFEYATTYSVRVMLRRSGQTSFVGYYGTACLYSTPAVTSPVGGAGSVQLQTYCDDTLPSINTLISTTSLQGATGYRFRVTNSLTGDVQTLDRPLHWFSLTMLQRFHYGTTYIIDVAVRTTQPFPTNPAEVAYGASCTVTTPALPSLTAYCDSVVPTKGTNITTASLNKATLYKFEVTRYTDATLSSIVDVSTLDRTQQWFTFNNISNYSPNTYYSVRVSVMTSGTFPESATPGQLLYSDACVIQSPSLAREIAPVATSMFEAVGYPNPYDYEFGIKLNTTSHSMVSIKVYNMVGKLIEQREVAPTEISVQAIGERFSTGVYNVVVSQDGNTKSLRMIKR